MSLNDKVSSAKVKVSEMLRSSRGRDTLLFLMFLVISFVFWLLLTLNNEVQEDIEVPVVLTDVPEDATLINTMPTSITVSVRDKGSSLVRYLWGRTPAMTIKFKDYADEVSSKLLLNETALSSRVRSYFGAGAQVVAVKPDSISVYYTTHPGRKVKVNIKADVKPNFQYIISGRIYADVDSVSLYSVGNECLAINQVETMPINLSDIKDTTMLDVSIRPIKGVRVIPDKIRVTVPIEPLIAKRQIVPIETRNLPGDVGMITFPSKVEVSYLIPMSSYNELRTDIKAYVDYGAITEKASKIPVMVSYHPEAYRNLSFTPDSVEYVIEKN